MLIVHDSSNIAMYEEHSKGIMQGIFTGGKTFYAILYET